MFGRPAAHARGATPLDQVVNAFSFTISDESGSEWSKLRKKYLADIFDEGLGGKPFVQRVREYGYTDRADPNQLDSSTKVRLSPWFCEYLEAIGDLRINQVLITGPAQCGKTLASTLLVSDILTFGRLNVAWTYSTHKVMQSNQPIQFRPVVDAWVAAAKAGGYDFIDSRDKKTVDRFQIGGVNGIFAYVSTSKSTSNQSGKAAAGSAIVSFTADAMFMEERSQYPPGAATPLPRRLDASIIPTKPIRELGTPGGGGGIEMEFKNATHYFYPHYQCPHCGAIKPLDPKGVLLKAHRHPRRGMCFLSEAGKPLHWFHKDSMDEVNSAYFGCSECGEELPDEVRHEALFRCTKTGITLRDFLDSIPPGVPEEYRKVVIHLSPLIRGDSTLAGRMIQAGLDAEDANDWQQQMLGHVSETSENRLTIDVLQAAIAAPPPERKSSVTLAGVDQGRGQWWIWVASYHLPPAWEGKPVEQVILKTQRRVITAKELLKGEIVDELKRHNVDFGFIDNEPERTAAGELQRISCLAMADQRNESLQHAIKKDSVRDGDGAIECWLIRNRKFLTQFLNTFLTLDDDGYPLQRLPSDWSRWVSNSSEISPIKHLMGPSVDPETGKWKRGPRNVDDLFYAGMFAEAAFYLWLTNPDEANKQEVLTRGSLAVTRNYKRRRR